MGGIKMPKLSNSADVRATALSEGSQPARRSHKRLILSSVSALSLALGFANTSFAQTAQTAQGGVEEVVVTGTRVLRDGYEAPSPLTVVSADQINAGAREDLASYVTLLPSVVGAFTPQTESTQTNPGNTGVSSVNLRGLGTFRTLTLLDGRRSVGAGIDGTIDISEFPQELISRIDVVTGGGSAAYGSDAIGGVVNFIIDKTFTGVKGSVEGGVTTYGDDRNWKATLSAGTNFANDRGHFLISGHVAARDGILSAQSRDFYTSGYNLFPNPFYTATNGAPQFTFQQGTGIWAATAGGIITNTALKGTAFGPGGTPYQFNFGSAIGGNYMIGGDWKAQSALRFGTIDPESRRQSLYTRASYDVTENFQIFAEVSWAHSSSHNTNSAVSGLGAYVIKGDNAFIPASVRARMTALGLTQFNLGRVNIDLNNSPGDREYKNAYFHRTLNRYTIGGNGNFDAFETNWKWEAYVHTGMTRTSEKSYNSITVANFNRAIDAVVSPTTGAIVCRSTLTDPTNGCVPFNMMGTNVNSRAAINYVTGTPQRNQRITQDNVSASFSGEPLSTWAGPVSIAAGFEWRKDAISGSNNALAAAFGADAPNYQPTFGSQSVAEGFIETVIPLAKDASWARSLDFNAAVRFTEYSLSGFGTSYKFGATYQPVDDLRFRATRSHDFRAPNLGELYSGGSNQNITLADPFNGGAITQAVSRTTGNANLTRETANTTQFGAVFQPTFLPGFSASMDYWHVKMKNGIGNISQLQILNNCFQGQQVFCNAISRNAGVITVLVYPFNLSSQKRNGIDFEAGYRFAMSDIVDSWGGNVELRVLATRYIKAIIDSGVGIPPVDYVGANGVVPGQINFGIPTWVYNTTLVFAYDPIRFTFTGRGFSSGTMDNSYIGCTAACPVSTTNNPTVDRNYMGGRFYVDMSVDYKVNDVASMFFAVQNLSNLKPAPYHSVALNGSSWTILNHSSSIYDTIGRAFRAGVRFKM
jgi:iron complex outermembrane receptor protein